MDPVAIHVGKSSGSSPGAEPPGEHELIQKAKSGDSEAFCLLVSQHQTRLFNTIYHVLGHAEDSQDVVQEAFLNAFLSISQFKEDSRFFTWIYRIALNVAISHRRKSMFRLNARMRTLDDPAGGASLAVSTSRVESGIEALDEAIRIQSAMERLSPDHRAVLVMKDMEDMRYESMAEILEVPIGTVRSRLHRARLELRLVLESQSESGKRGEE